MRRIARFVGSVIVVLLTGCSPSTRIENFADDEKESLARRYIQRLIDGDTTALLTELDPKLRSDNTAAQLQQMREMIPATAPSVTDLVGYNWRKFPGGAAEYNLTYQFNYGSKWLLVNAAWRELQDGTREIIGLRVQPLSASLQEINRFSFENAGVAHCAFLAAAIGIPIFVLATLVVCIRTKIARRKWLWVIFVLVGAISFSLNWTTGQIGFSPISIRLLGASVSTSSAYSPWIISFSIPIGAVVFWFKRRQLAASQPAVEPGQPV